MILDVRTGGDHFVLHLGRVCFVICQQIHKIHLFVNHSTNPNINNPHPHCCHHCPQPTNKATFTSTRHYLKTPKNWDEKGLSLEYNNNIEDEWCLGQFSSCDQAMTSNRELDILGGIIILAYVGHGHFPHFSFPHSNFPWKSSKIELKMSSHSCYHYLLTHWHQSTLDTGHRNHIRKSCEETNTLCTIQTYN